MNHLEARGESIQDSFDRFDTRYPEVYQKFKQFAREYVDVAMAKGQRAEDIRCSSKLIINRVRWEAHVGNITGQNSEESAQDRIYSEFKINDSFTSRYARKFNDEMEELGKTQWLNLFNLRGLRS